MISGRETKYRIERSRVFPPQHKTKSEKKYEKWTTAVKRTVPEYLNAREQTSQQTFNVPIAVGPDRVPPRLATLSGGRGCREGDAASNFR